MTARACKYLTMRGHRAGMQPTVQRCLMREDQLATLEFASLGKSFKTKVRSEIFSREICAEKF
jgi:hypothetical protein